VIDFIMKNKGKGLKGFSIESGELRLTLNENFVVLLANLLDQNVESYQRLVSLVGGKDN